MAKKLIQGSVVSQGFKEVWLVKRVWYKSMFMYPLPFYQCLRFDIESLN